MKPAIEDFDLLSPLHITGDMDPVEVLFDIEDIYSIYDNVFDASDLQESWEETKGKIDELHGELEQCLLWNADLQKYNSGFCLSIHSFDALNYQFSFDFQVPGSNKSKFYGSHKRIQGFIGKLKCIFEDLYFIVDDLQDKKPDLIEILREKIIANENESDFNSTDGEFDESYEEYKLFRRLKYVMDTISKAVKGSDFAENWSRYKKRLSKLPDRIKECRKNISEYRPDK